MEDVKESLDKLGSQNFEMEIKGHVLKGHLLDIDEELSLSRICSEYVDTPAYNTSVKCCTFALSLDSVDGSPFLYSISDLKEKERNERFEKATHFYRTLIDLYFVKYSETLSDMIEKLSDFKKK